MELKEFIADQKQLLDDFVRDYEHDRKKGKQQTMIRPSHQWVELLNEYKEMYDECAATT